MTSGKISTFGLMVAAVCGTVVLAAAVPNASAVKTSNETVTASILDNVTLIVTPPSAGSTACGAAATCDPNNIELDPETGDIATGWSDTYAATNNANGASLTISMVCDDSDTGTAGCQDQNTTSLVGVSDDAYAIDAFGTAAASTFSANEWAYRHFDITAAIAGLGHDYDIDTDVMTDTGTDADYGAVPLYAAPLDIWTAATWTDAGNKTIRNVYGAKADSTLRAQSYTNDAVFTLSVNP